MPFPVKESPSQHVLVYKIYGGYKFLGDTINARLQEINDNGGQVWGVDLHDHTEGRKKWSDYRAYMVVITYDME